MRKTKEECAKDKIKYCIGKLKYREHLITDNKDKRRLDSSIRALKKILRE